MQSRSSSNISGIDVSNWQGNIDFSKVKADGIEIVYIKATEGTYFIDPYRIVNFNNAKANDLKVGFYHFFRAKTEKEARSEAHYFISSISDFVENCDCKFCLDIETSQNLDRDTLSNLAIIFLEEVKALTGKDVVIYTYTYFAIRNLNSTLAQYPLWIAHYDTNTPGDNYIWNEWVGFQYTSTGRVNGVNGYCDMNEFTNKIFINKGEEFNMPDKVWVTTKVLNTAENPDGDGVNLTDIWIPKFEGVRVWCRQGDGGIFLESQFVDLETAKKIRANLGDMFRCYSFTEM